MDVMESPDQVGKPIVYHFLLETVAGFRVKLTATAGTSRY